MAKCISTHGWARSLILHSCWHCQCKNPNHDVDDRTTVVLVEYEAGTENIRGSSGSFGVATVSIPSSITVTALESTDSIKLFKSLTWARKHYVYLIGYIHGLDAAMEASARG